MYVRQDRHLTMVFEVITGNCVRSLKGCNSNPKGSLALFSKACVWGILVKVHRNESGLQFNLLSSALRLGTGAQIGVGGKIFFSWVRLTGLRLSGCGELCRLSPPRPEDSWFTPG